MKKLGNKKYCLIIVSLIFTICGLSSESFGQGTVINTSFYSNSLNTNRNVQIYLPEGYNPQNFVRYPVVYFLHGANVNQNSYIQLFGILDNLIGDSIISPIILVKPDGSVQPWAGSFYTNSALYGNFEDYIAFDLVEFIDSAYKTISSRETRAIMGHSMGAYGAIKLAFKHPDIYCGVVSNSGPLDFNKFTLWIPWVVAENGGVPVNLYDPNAGIITLLSYSMAGAFSPNLNTPPYLVDFPLDSLGNLIDSTWNRWLLHNPTLLARNINNGSGLSIFFDCGIQDEFQLYSFNTAFADSLDELNLNYEFQSFNGGHTNQLLTRFPIAFQFLDSVMNQITISINPTELDFGEVAIDSSSTMIFTIMNTGNADLEVTNISSNEPAFTVNITSAIVPPDSSQDVEVTFTPNGVLSFNGIIEITHNALGSPDTVAVTGNGITGVEEELKPLTFSLEQNFPNPFNPITTFRYSIPQTSKVVLKVYDVLGNEIALLMNEEKTVGTYEITWNAEQLTSGVYFYQLKVTPNGGQAGNFVETKKMILLR